MKIRLLLCITLVCDIDIHVTAIDQFRAAVYEHAVTVPSDRSTVLTRHEAIDVMMKNLHVYREQAIKASAMGAKIIVFPEYGLFGLNWTRESIQPFLEYIPDINTTKWNPCDAPKVYPRTEIQKNLSCIAKNASMYLVANIGARQPCDNTDPDCPPDMHYQFSANVVYGPNGDFIARYFKYNLYTKEKHFDKPHKLDITTFDTPFGRFGTFTSADILYHDPAVRLIKMMNVTNIAYPTAWQDALPLMAAIEFHSAFAEGLLINLLAANLHIPSQGYHGSGLYWPTGTSVNASYYYNARASSKGFLVVDDMTPFVIPPQKKSFHSHLDFLNFQSRSFERSAAENVMDDTDLDTVKSIERIDDNVEITINNDVYTVLLL